MFKVPEQYRYQGMQFLWSDSSHGNNGFFIIPHSKLELRCQASDGYLWEHVSVSIARPGKKAVCDPSWQHMCIVKELFWEPEDCVIQYHPPESAYVNHHPFVLHLWRPIGTTIPTPDPRLVGPLP